MSRQPSNQQQKVLDFLVTFYVANDALPTSADIARAFGYASNNAANEHILRLAKKGYLEKNEGGNYRFSRNLPHPGWAYVIHQAATLGRLPDGRVQ